MVYLKIVVPLLEMAAVFRILCKREHMYHFRESQRFNQRWLWVVLVLVAAVSFGSIYFTAADLEDNTLDLTQIIVGILGPLSVFLLLRVFRLEVTVNDIGITYRFFPMHFSERSILWDDVDKVEVRRYKPIREYGGWGIRYSFRNGRAYNVSGNMGMQLVMKNGKKILFGTQKVGELKEVLRSLGKVSL